MKVLIGIAVYRYLCANGPLSVGKTLGWMLTPRRQNREYCFAIRVTGINNLMQWMVLRSVGPTFQGRLIQVDLDLLYVLDFMESPDSSGITLKMKQKSWAKAFYRYFCIKLHIFKYQITSTIRKTLDSIIKINKSHNFKPAHEVSLFWYAHYPEA